MRSQELIPVQRASIASCTMMTPVLNFSGRFCAEVSRGGAFD